MSDPNKRVVFQNDQGGISVLILPRPEDCSLTVHQIAAKDVPTGRPYKILDVSEIPTDRLERMAWTVDEADLTDGVGG